MKTTKGFTLIELIVSMTIMAILTGYGIPTFQQLKLNSIMDSERNRLTGSFQYARNVAITNQSYVIVCPSLSGKQCDNKSNWHEGWIVFSDINKNRNVDKEDVILRFEDAMRGKINATASVHRQKIRFNNVGFSPGTNVSINFCDKRGKDDAKSIIINNAGRVKQSKPISNKVCT